MNEQLILALYFPYVRCKPWKLKRSPKLLEVERILRGMLKADGLCKFLAGLQDLSEELVWQLLQNHQALPFQIARPENNEGHKWQKKKDQAGFMCARPGDMLSAPFQCDICWFVNIQKR